MGVILLSYKEVWTFSYKHWFPDFSSIRNTFPSEITVSSMCTCCLHSISSSGELTALFPLEKMRLNFSQWHLIVPATLSLFPPPSSPPPPPPLPLPPSFSSFLLGQLGKVLSSSRIRSCKDDVSGASYSHMKIAFCAKK